MTSTQEMFKPDSYTAQVQAAQVSWKSGDSSQLFILREGHGDQ